MKYKPFSLWLVRKPELLKEFNEVYTMVCENETFRNYVRNSIEAIDPVTGEKGLPLRKYDFAALECYDRVVGAEKRFEENKAAYEARERAKLNVEPS